MNSGDFSKFIVSFGSMNNYQSSVDETKQFLEDKENIMLPQSDKALIYDALDGIAAIRNQGFNSNGIIEVNKAFIYSKEEDPQWPGHLRNDIYNPDDAIGIITNPNGTTKDAYYPPDVVYKGALDDIVTEFNFSRKTERDAWKVFAKISKLQPFQDGNKRTALIAANGALNTWEKKSYLLLPFDKYTRRKFIIMLMQFYKAKNENEENKILDNIIDLTC